MTAAVLGISCRHHRRQDTAPHFHVAGVWLKVYQTKVCLDCDAELCQSGSKCPGPEQTDTIHHWRCRQCGQRWQTPSQIRKTLLLPRHKRQPPPVQCPNCRETKRIAHNCPTYEPPVYQARQPGKLQRFLIPRQTIRPRHQR